MVLSQQVLGELQKDKEKAKDKEAKATEVVFNIWDFGGNKQIV